MINKWKLKAPHKYDTKQNMTRQKKEYINNIQNKNTKCLKYETPLKLRKTINYVT